MNVSVKSLVVLSVLAALSAACQTKPAISQQQANAPQNPEATEGPPSGAEQEKQKEKGSTSAEFAEFEGYYLAQGEQGSTVIRISADGRIETLAQTASSRGYSWSYLRSSDKATFIVTRTDCLSAPEPACREYAPNVLNIESQQMIVKAGADLDILESVVIAKKGQPIQSLKAISAEEAQAKAAEAGQTPTQSQNQPEQADETAQK